MNIPEGFVLVPVEPTARMLDASVNDGQGAKNLRSKMARDSYSLMIAAAPPVELPAYNEAAELAACRAHWEKNPNCLFSDMWIGWQACAQSRDGSSE